MVPNPAPHVLGSGNQRGTPSQHFDSAKHTSIPDSVMGFAIGADSVPSSVTNPYSNSQVIHPRHPSGLSPLGAMICKSLTKSVLRLSNPKWHDSFGTTRSLVHCHAVERHLNAKPHRKAPRINPVYLSCWRALPSGFGFIRALCAKQSPTIFGSARGDHLAEAVVLRKVLLARLFGYDNRILPMTKALFATTAAALLGPFCFARTRASACPSDPPWCSHLRRQCRGKDGTRQE